MLKIGNLQLKSNVLLAPVAGYTDVGFRAVCRAAGAGLTYTEMVSAKGLCYENANTKYLLAALEREDIAALSKEYRGTSLESAVSVLSEESPRAVQLFGSESEFIARAVSHPDLRRFDLIDINMGCPMRKIVSNGDGSALMDNPQRIESVVKAAVMAAGGRPVTVKLRAGRTRESVNAVECALAAESGGASAVTVHGRTADMFYSGKSDITVAAAVKKAVRIPVIVNGDLNSGADIESALKESGCDGAMLARGALGNPYIFTQSALDGFNLSPKAAIMLHIAVLRRFLPDRVVANNLKKHLCYWASALPRPKAVRIALGAINCLSDLIQFVEESFC